MDDKRLVKVSRYLSRHLRHQPERLGLSLGPGGWIAVDELLAACAAHSFAVTREELQEVVARNDKRRFAFDATGTRIRANQGHSVEIDLELEPVEPPAVLFHGTARARLDAILAEGLRKMGRHHVHLSADAETASRVRARHGKPVVLEVAAARMAADGHVFLRSANGVWLTDAVPPDYLAPL
jgi:putative RNA 2'-phosphotransferase